MPHRRCVVCERLLCLLVGSKECTPSIASFPKSQASVDTQSALRVTMYIVVRVRRSRSPSRTRPESLMWREPRFDVHHIPHTSDAIVRLVFVTDISCVVLHCALYHAQMENTRLRFVVKALCRRHALNTSVASDQTEARDGMHTASSPSVSTSIPLSATPPSLPSPSPPSPSVLISAASEMSAGRVKRKRLKSWETSAHFANDLCEVCAEQPSRKKEFLFAGCLHGMCRPFMTAHLKARRRCCHVCQVDFQDRLVEMGAPITIKHVLADSKNTESCAVRRRRKNK